MIKRSHFDGRVIDENFKLPEFDAEVIHEIPQNTEVVVIRRKGQGYDGGHNTAARLGWSVYNAEPSDEAIAWWDDTHQGSFTGFWPAICEVRIFDGEKCALDAHNYIINKVLAWYITPKILLEQANRIENLREWLDDGLLRDLARAEYTVAGNTDGLKEAKEKWHHATRPNGKPAKQYSFTAQYPTNVVGDRIDKSDPLQGDCLQQIGRRNIYVAGQGSSKDKDFIIISKLENKIFRIECIDDDEESITVKFAKELRDMGIDKDFCRRLFFDEGEIRVKIRSGNCLRSESETVSRIWYRRGDYLSLFDFKDIPVSGKIVISMTTPYGQSAKIEPSGRVPLYEALYEVHSNDPGWVSNSMNGLPAISTVEF